MGLLFSYSYILLCIYLTNLTKSNVFVHIVVRLGHHVGRFLSLSIEIGIKCLSQGYSHVLPSRELNVLYKQTDRLLFYKLFCF